MVQALKDYPNVGHSVYRCPRSKNTPANKFLQTTIVQIIATSVLKLEISKDDNSAVFTLSIKEENASPNYLHDCFWAGIPLVVD